MDAFYYTLQSNASKDYFPTNTPTNFKIHLPTQINLEGDWLVGLVEIHFPAEFESRKRKLPPQDAEVNKRTAREAFTSMRISRRYNPSASTIGTVMRKRVAKKDETPALTGSDISK